MGYLRYLRKVDPNPPPAWYSSANANEWTALPNSTLSTSGVGWSGTSPGGSGTYTAVVTAWSGGILNTVGCFYDGAFHSGTFLVIWGGGHSDYYGNELYAFGPLEAGPTGWGWHRLTDPTIPAPEDVARDANGNPVSRHTYDMLQFLPTLNKMISTGIAAAASRAWNFPKADLFDFSVNPAEESPWSNADTGFPWTNTYDLTDMKSGYNPLTNKVWAIGHGNSHKLVSYDVETGTWTGYAKDNPNSPTDGKAAICPSLNLLVFIGQTGTVYVQDLDDPTSSIYTPTVTGEGPGKKGPIEWDEAGERFVMWPNAGGQTLYFLTFSDKSNAAWSSLTPAGGDTVGSPTGTHGTFGRFRMVNGAMRGVLLMPNYNAPVAFFKMAA